MRDAIFIISKPSLGTTSPGDADFGAAMLERFLHAAEKQIPRPRAIVFMTEGVKAATRDGAFALPLGLLHGLGVRLVSCRTCLDHYGIAQDRVLGEVTGMDEILHLMGQASKVINL